jgi:hypothetical protein
MEAICPGYVRSKYETCMVNDVDLSHFSLKNQFQKQSKKCGCLKNSGKMRIYP